ncbi:hypothetical protein [Antarcticimicrobium sediminis]|uniref:Uncharacterized protein n=1 Tax=Antarcticimicrobium sediminis TaxID=2546227 RepID=A0A4R5F118_9RHOB|nr:hypothetical protein [Antarcticimicrobium sediminis]TDE40840.1 hypothetical protein E1B25_01065 [Antarcticimicrobium sediminis]
MNKTLYGGAPLFAALDILDFLRRNGDSLSELLEGIAGDRGLDLYLGTDRLLDSQSPDPARVGKALREIRDLLEAAGVPDDRFAAPLRWHWARLTDFVARLPG